MRNRVRAAASPGRGISHKAGLWDTRRVLMAPHQRQSSVLGFILIASAVLAAIVIGAVVARGESIVITWNRAVLDAIRAETTPR